MTWAHTNEDAGTIAALRGYFEAHEAASAAIDAQHFAEYMAHSNKLAAYLRACRRPTFDEMRDHYRARSKVAA